MQQRVFIVCLLASAEPSLLNSILLPAQQEGLHPPDYAESATLTSINTMIATIIAEASARASDSMISRPIPRSAPIYLPQRCGNC
jgi:hypothetical protein